jgi:hypothetical protein
MSPLLRAAAVAATLAGVVLAGTGPAHAAPTTSGPDPAGPPVPLSMAAAIAYNQCVSGGPTSSDTTIANRLRPQMNGQRLGQALTAYNVSCARVISATMAGRGLDKRAAVIAITTAITESILHNYTQAVDHDSLGLFQQRPSQGWGTPTQLIDPIYATNAFINAMLRKYPNNSWMSGDIGAICQAVQISAVPDAYRHEVHDAQLLADALWTGGGGSGASRYWVDTFAAAPVFGSPTSTSQTGTLNAGTKLRLLQGVGPADRQRQRLQPLLAPDRPGQRPGRPVRLGVLPEPLGQRRGQGQQRHGHPGLLTGR